MAKGNRKRANKSKSVKKEEPKKEVKKAPKSKIRDVAAELDVPLINNMHVEMMKETVNIAARVGKLINQQQKKINQIAMGESFIKDLKSGKVKPPFMVKKGENLFVPFNDTKALIKNIELENKQIKDSIQLSEGQLSHWYDEYKSSLIRQFRMLQGVLKDHMDELTTISGHTKKSGKAKEDEEKAFMKQFDLQNPKDVEKAKKEIKKVTKNADSTGKSGKKDS